MSLCNIHKFILKGQYRHYLNRLSEGMQSVSSFKMNTVTENYWLTNATATVIIMTLSCGVLFLITELM